MRISETIQRLQAARPMMPQPALDRLVDLNSFGSNPGDLRARSYVPDRLAAREPLVVVLHGCTQNAAGYDDGAGWSRLADRHGFALLFPEQQRANNSHLCFNWFQPGDSSRGSGEAASIAQMIGAMVDQHGLDPNRVFVTGLSAGGAMAGVMLATYPELFAGGAIIAGIAYGCADTVGEALSSMGGRGRLSRAALGAAVREASPHAGPWPRVSVWHGSADYTVSASNGDDVALQWLDVHGLSETPTATDRVDGYPRQVWRGADGRVLVEQYEITGMGHGTPLAPGDASGRSGVAGPHMLDVAISSTDRIAAFWEIAPEPDALQQRRAPATPAFPQPMRGNPAANGSATIENALRSAGLMR